jgi:hypothetical protein
LNGQRYFLELNSTLNADNFTKSYLDFIASENAKNKGSIGGYVLNWGPAHNSKLIAFWKMVYAYAGQFKAFVNPPWTGDRSFGRLESADAVASMYGGSVGPSVPQIVLPSDGDRQGIGCPENVTGATCPFWATLDSNPSNVPPGQGLTAQVQATSDAEELTFNWYLIGGTSNSFTGNILGEQKDPQDFTSAATGSNECPTGVESECGPPAMPTKGQLLDVTTTRDGDNWTSVVIFNAPTGASPGNNYQLRVVILDGRGGAATAAVGFPMQ